MKNQITYQKDGIVVNGQLIELSVITDNCNIAKIKEDKIVILKMEWPSSRGFEGIVELIACSTEQAEVIKKHIVGKHIDFGEIAGKHSEVCGTLEASEVETITDISEIQDFLKQYPNGHEYDHSFIETYFNYACCMVEEESFYEMTEEDIQEFEKAYSPAV